MMHRISTAELDWMSSMCLGNTDRSTPTEPPMPKHPTAHPATPTAAPSERDAVIAAIAQSHLGLETLESRDSDSLDFTEHGCVAIRDALRAAFEAGKQTARRRRAGGAPIVPTTVIRGDIVLTSPTPKAGSGDWVEGRIGAFRFCAKVYPEHALDPSFEIGRSRISKLELRRLDTGAVAFNWDRGPDIAATDADAQAAVARLAAHLAKHCFGPLA